GFDQTHQNAEPQHAVRADGGRNNEKVRDKGRARRDIAQNDADETGEEGQSRLNDDEPDKAHRNAVVDGQMTERHCDVDVGDHACGADDAEQEQLDADEGYIQIPVCEQLTQTAQECAPVEADRTQNDDRQDADDAGENGHDGCAEQLGQG